MTGPGIASLDGVVVVDKPVGPTSHDVVAAVRRSAGTRRVGHTGTLDPFASGVLPLVVGRATRLAQFLAGDAKIYRAEIRFGIDTDTHDLTGRPTFVAHTEALPSRADVEVALRGFVGRQEQVPPAFSAKQVEGVRSYALARRDAAAPLRPVPVEVFELVVEAMDGAQARVRLACGSGFYVRALARDLGRALGCGAHLLALRRLGSGEFTEVEAVPLAALSHQQAVAGALRPLESLLPWMPAARLSERGAERAAHGNPVGPGDVIEWSGDSGRVRLQPDSDEGCGSVVRLMGLDGRLLGLARAPEPGESALRPFVVLV
jgi:tRNA pseudouridine55 synthase